MKKKQRNITDFLDKKISDKKTNQIKGGRYTIRRHRNNTTTTTTAIWDDVEIRRAKRSFFDGL